ncbi:MAG: penicillin-binding protein 2 [Leptotrichiaceae bacterium]|nr:penicillin-binding protein 2 [Leptotrichiaceae bacterium]MBP6281792.1 penicillin-binding protein 2 [Leptotrichiaceae bacterium]
MRELDKEEKSPRYILFIGITGIVFLLLILKLFTLQILDASTYEEKALKNRIRTNVVKAARGEIYDREGKLLAKNTTGYQLVHYDTKNLSSSEISILREIQGLTDEQIEKRLFNEKKSRAEKLRETIFNIRKISSLTGYTTDYIITRFEKQPRTGTSNKILVIEDLDKSIALKAIEKLDNDKIDIVEYNKRYYPEDSIASHVIGNVKPISNEEYEKLKDKGYLNDDLIGKKGVEKQYDKEIKGQNGTEYVEVDVHGNIIKEIKNVESIRGKNIYLSIDLELQKYMTEAFSGRSGVFIALEAKTGKIITFVSNPEINLNLLSSRITDAQWSELVNSKSKPLLNKGIAGLYPPGSTFKAVTGLAILESGISPYDTVMSTGLYKYGELGFRDSSSRGHGITNFAKSIEESVNTYYYYYSQRAGVSNIVKYAKEFGIGERTGIDIPGEQSGTLPTPEWKKSRFKKRQDQTWLPGDLINMSIGQGYVLMTPIQVAMVYQAIANDGIMLRPTVVDKFLSYDGKEEVRQPVEQRKLGISNKNLKLLQNALKLPVSSNRGTANILRIPGYPVSAKTGTAQNTGFKDHHSWILGYFPSDNPKIVFVSIVEGGGYGGVASGQMARMFINKYREKYEFNKNISDDKTKIKK